MAEQEGRMEIWVLGEIVGTASGYDFIDCTSFSFYDAELTGILKNIFRHGIIKCLNIEYLTGIIEAYHDGECIGSSRLTAIVN